MRTNLLVRPCPVDVSDARAKPLSPWTHLRPYRRRVAVGIVLLLATNALALTIPYLLGQTIDALRGPDPAAEVPLLALLMVAFAAGKALIRVGSRVTIFDAARMAEHDLRSQLFAHLLRLEPAFHRENPTGDTMSRLTTDVQTVRALWGPGILNVVNTTMIFASALVLMILIDPMLTLWAMLPYPIIIVMGRLFGRHIYRASSAVQKQLGGISNTVQEDLAGIGIIKTYTLEERRRDNFATMSETLLGHNMVLTRIRGSLMPILGGLAALGAVAVIWIGGQAVIDGRIGLGQMIQFNAYLGLLLWPTLALGWMLSLLQRGLASWARLRSILTTEPQIVGGDRPVPTPVGGAIEIRDLTVAIDGRVLLDEISLAIPAGSVTAVVGRTGAGKSLLVEALPRLIDIPAGSVFLDGVDVTELPLANLRGAIGYAPQEAFLFSTTIAANIGFGRDETAPEVLVAAALAAGLERDLAAIPDGYDTVVGERGITLSGGQRQRVALARALASDPRILILDDSLSSVDAETERHILGQLSGVLAGRTAILISHRVAAVKRADQIIVLDEGRVVETGTYAELMSAGGLYAELYQSQLADNTLAGLANGEADA